MVKSRTNLFLVAIFFAVVFNLSCHSENEARFESQKKSLQFKVGEDFPYHDFLDSSGILTRIDFSKSELTIVDFWFNSCPSCIEEMKKFEEAIEGKNVAIMSVSINSFQEWKKSLKDSSRFKFLQKAVPNWVHYTIKSEDNPKLNNRISVDVQKKLVDDLNVTFYPAYFVVNKLGKIIARPVSAVGYIQNL